MASLKRGHSFSGEGRGFCTRCIRAQKTCYCSDIVPVRTQIEFVILQHPLEHRNSIGTARMTYHSIENSKLLVGTHFDDNAAVTRLIGNEDNHCVVLYPGAFAQNLSLLSSDEIRCAFPEQKTLVIFVIDGTWPCAKKMLRNSLNLSSLPQICFTPKTESGYRIRLQPNKHCLSTIEAVHHLIGILDPKVDSSNLLKVFHRMIERQIQYTKEALV